ncbi:hypothetical protein DICPUDRAFT_147392 [Dictyostelium purpureum]|uniref:Transcriptional regulator of RNA polII, SAGA, subunit-domain-containing protein n=1 Tax=Dictyostelium purpureum TaxID=5786 RepID=F0Z8E0_DICPU|nr:uncharacterized protein DICPUDRAFT_147392 [Dictyostelium purpureum]EGC39825.1 hypothetical protein DICPUDRAFT_147392 [Dictyostelium purpureum]|eukprot:XP_003283692.1 hypothetical protein DICPUDRAFT_147392 [Dictyostelium purpureum]
MTKAPNENIGSNTGTSASSSSSSTSTSIPANPTNNIINLPTPYDISYERIDLAPLKKQLDAVLKDRSEDYWEWIRRFLAGKLSKRELDYYVQTNLTEAYLHLHNQFFKAVIFNAFYSKTSPPPIMESAKSAQTASALDKKRKQPSTAVKPNKKESKKRKDGLPTTSPTVASTSPIPAASTAATPSTSSNKSIKKTPSNKTIKKPQSSSSKLSKQKKKYYPKYSLYSSQLQTLKEKMETIASEHGLEGISKQSIIYMKLALEQHIINFVNRTKPHLISKNVEPPLQPNQVIPQFLNFDNTDNNNNNFNIDNNINSKNNIDNYNMDTSGNSYNEFLENSDNTNDKPSTNMDVNIQESNNNNNNNENKDQTMTDNQNTNINDNNQAKDPTIPYNIDNNYQSNNTINNYNNYNMDISNNNNNNNNNKVFKFSDVFNFKKPIEELKVSYPKYVESNNPYLSQPISFYKIPENIFSSSRTKECESIISTQDLFTMIEENPQILRDDQLSYERINLLRY